MNLETKAPLATEIPEGYFQDMDGFRKIPHNISFMEDHGAVIPPMAGAAVDYSIYAAFSQAHRQDEDMQEVLNHLDYIIDQLGIFRSNILKHV